MRVPALPAYAKLALLLVFVALTNPSAPARVRELLAREEYAGLAVFLAIWAVSLACLVVVGFLPRLRWRLLWAVPIAVSVFAGEGFYQIARARLTLDGAVILWIERARWGDAVAAYGGWLVRAGLEAAAGVLVLALPARLPEHATRLLSRLWWVPALPIALILAVLVARGGFGTGGLPHQFRAATLLATAVAIDAVSDLGARRRSPEIEPVRAPATAGDVVLVIDESVRADFLDLNEDRGTTPFLASRAAQVANFGAAVAAGNCSNSSNAAIRLGGTRADFASSIHESPFIWEYAKRAGFETVYLDAQKGFGGLQNWMTPREVVHIDRFEQFPGVGRLERDRVLAARLRALLLDERQQFVIVNKSGAHFPYENGYPPSDAHFAPHMKAGASIGGSREKLVNSYKNLVRWNVDGFFRELIGADLPEGALILYTSDHGQNLMNRGVVLHCNTQTPHPYEAWVPLLVLTAGPDQDFGAAARRNRGRATHFEIYPTLLRLFGYDPLQVAEQYGPDLFAALPEGGRRFTVGPVLLYFGRQIRWIDVPDAFGTD